MHITLLKIILLGALSISSSAADFQFLVYSDVQGGGEGNHAKLPGIISRIPGGVACAVSCGDMAGLGNSTVASASTWDNYLATALNLGAPFWPCRGNHDGVEDAGGVTLGHWKNAMSFIRNRTEYQSGSIDNEYYSFMYHNCLFVVLDNMSANKTAQKTWLASEVQTTRAKKADHIFVFFHYPGLASNQPESERTSQYWDAYITPYFESMSNFSGVFWGDSHRFFATKYKGISGVLVPSATTPRDTLPLGPGEIGGSFSGYILVHVKGDSVLTKACDYSENVRASFVMKKYNPYDPMPVMNIQAIALSTTIEQYLGTRVRAVITYQDTANGGALLNDSTYEVDYLALDPGVATVDSLGNVVGITLGDARIRVGKRSVYDTVTITVAASTAILDSIRLSRNLLSIQSGKTFSFTATGYYHNQTVSFKREINADAAWSVSDSLLGTVVNGTLTAGSGGKSGSLTVMLSGRADTCHLNVLSFLARVNFETDTIPPFAGWRSDNARLFTDARGMGWLTSVSSTTRNDRDSGELLGSFVTRTGETEFKISAPDGRYVIKLGVGCNKYGGLCTVTHGTRVIVNHSAVANAVVVDTVTVSGGTGLVLKVVGPICYLVAMSDQGFDIMAVAEDLGLALKSPIPPSSNADMSTLVPEAGFMVSPNPFNPSLSMSFAGNSNGQHRIRICDLRGHIIEDFKLALGQTTLTWKAKGISSGYYLINLITEDKVFTRRVLLVR